MTAEQARDRLAAYLERRAGMNGIDPEHIHGILNEDGRFDLLASDVHAVIAAGDAAVETVKRVKELLARDVHVVDLGETEFGLQHGFPCRPDLLGCPVNQALHDLDGPPAPPGRYLVSLDELGKINIGERVADDFDPLVADLRAVLYGPDTGGDSSLTAFGAAVRLEHARQRDTERRPATGGDRG